jgi:pyruvate dehydrogenase E1 component alpha subunit
LQIAADSSELISEIPNDSSETFKVTIDPESFKAYKCDPPEPEVSVSKDGLLEMYHQMQTMRRMEMAADALYKAKLIRGFCHLTIGQEAISIGLESAITPEDRVITAYRCHPFAVLRGGTVKGVIAELLGEYLCSFVKAPASIVSLL